LDTKGDRKALLKRLLEFGANVKAEQIRRNEEMRKERETGSGDLADSQPSSFAVGAFDAQWERKSVISPRVKQLLFPVVKENNVQMIFSKFILKTKREKVLKKYPPFVGLPEYVPHLPNSWAVGLTQSQKAQNASLANMHQRFYDVMRPLASLTQDIIQATQDSQDEDRTNKSVLEIVPTSHEEALIDLAALLMSAIAQMNTYRSQVNYKQVGGFKFANLLKPKADEQKRVSIHQAEDTKKLLSINKARKAINNFSRQFRGRGRSWGRGRYTGGRSSNGWSYGSRYKSKGRGRGSKSGGRVLQQSKGRGRGRGRGRDRQENS